MSFEVCRVKEPLEFKAFYDERSIFKDVNGFFRRFLVKNQPCILAETFTKEWPCRSEWVTDGAPNLRSVFRRRDEMGRLPVANCDQLEFDSHPKMEMSPTEYETYWNAFHDGRDSRLLYLKDWHFCWTYEPESVYHWPEYFSSDWMNEFWAFRCDLRDDFRFVYIGPRGTWTPLHADVYCSYSWSANVCGRKRWILFKPGEEEKLRLKDKSLPPDVRHLDLSSIEHADFIQEPGEIFFVPSGWFHQVMNETDVISLNHNWINACAAPAAWKFLRRELDQVKDSVSDVKDTPGWEEQTQIMLNALAGIDFLVLFVLFKFVLLRSLSTLSGMTDLGPYSIPEDSRDSPAAISAQLDQRLRQLRADVGKRRPDDRQWLALHEARTCSQLLLEVIVDADMVRILEGENLNQMATLFGEFATWLDT